MVEMQIKYILFISVFQIIGNKKEKRKKKKSSVIVSISGLHREIIFAVINDLQARVQLDIFIVRHKR